MISQQNPRKTPLLLLLLLLLVPAALSTTPPTKPLTPTHRSKSSNHFLIFLSRLPATCFINARRVAHLSKPGKTVLRLPRKLQPGDLITVVAYPHPNSPAKRPAIMLMGPGLNSQTTWRAQFVLKDALNDKSWMLRKTYPPVCKWKHPAVVDTPSNGAASFIWPRGPRPDKHVARFRYVVGGADARSCSGSKSMSMAVIKVAATDRAWVFVNGVHLMDVLSKNKVASKRYRLAKGDVISVKAMDMVPKRGPGASKHEFGFVVDIHYKGTHITTQPGKGPWKVTAMYKTPDQAKQFAFMKKGFNDCSWKLPVKPKYPPMKWAKPFPYTHGARYVWAPNAQRPSTVVFARLVIEGDDNRCKGDGDDDNLSGQSGPEEKTTTCACEMVASADGSVCYYYIDSRRQTCDRRQCEPKYVCTGKQETQDSLICIKKLLTHRIVPIEGTDKCKLNPDQHHIYVPYNKE